MNAMLQQFYMIPAFRYMLLEADDKAKEDLKPYRDAMVDDNVLHQTQRMFGFLELSERQDYNPFMFTFSFKDMDGNPTNTSLQQDSFEFVNVAFDRLENLLKPTPQKYLLKNMFAGVVCNQVIPYFFNR